MADLKKDEKKDIRSLIVSDTAKKQFLAALPKHITPDRFTRIALTTYSKTPALSKCTVESLWSCLLDCSQLGIEPDGRKAHLIPYGDKCTLVIDYKGLVDLARRSGEISYIHADVVCEKDDFEYAYGSGARLNHKPADKNRGEAKLAYSFVKLKDGSEDFCVMNRDEIEAIRKRSKAGSNGPWVTDWNEMAKKTVFRRHSKWLPVSSEKFFEAVEKDFDTPSDLTTHFQLEHDEVLMPKATDAEEPPKKTGKVQPKPAAPVPAAAVPLASPKHVENLRKMAAQAGIATDDQFLDFLVEVGVSDADAITIEEYIIAMQKALEKIDEKASV